MAGKFSRSKGIRFEREIVKTIRSYGYEAERIPLSGAMGTFKGDVRGKIAGKELLFECKTLANGFKFLYTNLGDNNALLLKSDRQEPLIVFTFNQWLDLVSELDIKVLTGEK